MGFAKRFLIALALAGVPLSVAAPVGNVADDGQMVPGRTEVLAPEIADHDRREEGLPGFVGIEKQSQGKMATETT